MQNNAKSSENILSSNVNVGSRRGNEKPVLIRHATPPDSTNRFKITS